MNIYIISVLLLIFVGKILISMKNLLKSHKYLTENKGYSVSISEDQLNNILILIPVIKEQKVIGDTLDHFITMNTEGLILNIVIIGTINEIIQKESELANLESYYKKLKYSNIRSNKVKSILDRLFTQETSEIILKDIVNIDFARFKQHYIDDLSTYDKVNLWLNKNQDSNIHVFYIESPIENGDRATQLNYALNRMKNDIDFDIVGVYDADSRPHKNTLRYVSAQMQITNCDACQQPLHFISSISQFETSKNNPIISASAILQSTWSLTKELPNLINYNEVGSKENIRCLYLNGHGEFFTRNILDEFGGFPADVITDGVQIGYRLSMRKKMIQSIPLFCDDQMTDSINQLITQNSRWYAGCMKVKDAYLWSKERDSSTKITHLFDGYNILLSWAFGPITVIIMILSIVIILPNNVERCMLLGFVMALLMLYIYLEPYIAIRIVHNNRTPIRLQTWLMMPVAYLLKSIGPQVYFYKQFRHKMFGDVISYKKVER